MEIFVFISCFSFFLSQDVSQGCQCEAPAAAFGWWEQWEQSVCGPTVVLKLRNVGLLSEGGRPSWLYHQLQQVASPQGDGGGRKRHEECLTNIGTFWQSFSFFVHLMTIRDISERGNQDKLVLIVFDMRNVVEADNLENIREKQPVNRSHGSGEWYRGNNVYQGLVGNNWDIMGSVTSCLGNKVGVYLSPNDGQVVSQCLTCLHISLCRLSTFDCV